LAGLPTRHCRWFDAFAAAAGKEFERWGIRDWKRLEARQTMPDREYVDLVRNGYLRFMPGH
jgi:hypothetical protein